MTFPQALHKQKERLTHIGAGQLCFGFFALFCLLLILKNADIAIEYMSRGLLLCARTVIPSLFPFMVLSELIVSGGFGAALFRHIPRAVRRPFGLSESGCCALLLGMLCGFPVGAKCTVLAFRQGRMSRTEAERVLAFSANPSSAFLISAVGTSLWGSRRFGVALYATVLAVGLLCGFLLNLFYKERKETYRSASRILLESTPPLTGAKLFTEAVRSATGSILLVCAYVIFFSALIGTLNLVLSPLGLPAELHAGLFCLFELSGGVSQAASLGSSRFAAMLCAFAAGWSGLSVHCQILSVCDGCGFSFRPYFAAKLLQGILCALVFGILLAIFPTLMFPGVGV